MSPPRPNSQRRAAALLALLGVPAVAAVFLAGGGLALLPALLLLLPILVLGRAPGVETLSRAGTRPRARRTRPGSDRAPDLPEPNRLRPALLIARSLAERGPPVSPAPAN